MNSMAICIRCGKKGWFKSITTCETCSDKLCDDCFEIYWDKFTDRWRYKLDDEELKIIWECQKCRDKRLGERDEDRDEIKIKTKNGEIRYVTKETEKTIVRVMLCPTCKGEVYPRKPGDGGWWYTCENCRITWDTSVPSALDSPKLHYFMKYSCPYCKEEIVGSCYLNFVDANFFYCHKCFVREVLEPMFKMNKPSDKELEREFLEESLDKIFFFSLQKSEIRGKADAPSALSGTILENYVSIISKIEPTIIDFELRGPFKLRTLKEIPFDQVPWVREGIRQLEDKKMRMEKGEKDYKKRQRTKQLIAEGLKYAGDKSATECGEEILRINDCSYYGKPENWEQYFGQFLKWLHESSEADLRKSQSRILEALEKGKQLMQYLKETEDDSYSGIPQGIDELMKEHLIVVPQAVSMLEKSSKKYFLKP